MASKTFAGALSIYSGSYTAIGGLIDCTFPALEADAPVDTTAHDSTSGVRTNIPVGTFKWPELTFQCNDIPADAGQVLVLASLGVSSKFKFVSAAGRTSYLNGIVVKWSPDAQPINGKATISGQVVPSGVAPVS